MPTSSTKTNAVEDDTSRMKETGKLDDKNRDKEATEEHSVKTLTKYKYNALNRPALMFSFSDPKRMAWDWVLAVLLLYIIIATPLEVAFNEPATLFWINLGRVVDSLFWIDLFVSFRTTFCDKKGEEIWDPFVCAKVYLKGWFLLDFATCVFAFPLTYIYEEAFGFSVSGATAAKLGKGPRVLKVVRSLRVVKLLRAAKMSEVFEDLRDNFSGMFFVVKMLRVFFVTGFFLHLNACGFCMVANGQEAGESWLDNFGGDAGRDDLSWDEQYVLGFYWAATTCTTVGYGDIYPISYSEKVYVIFTMLLGVIFFGYLIGVITEMITSSGHVQQQLDEKMEEVYCFIKKNGLSAKLAKNVRIFFRSHFQERRIVDTRKIMEMLPARLLEETREEMIGEGLYNVPFFQRLPIQFFPAAVSLIEAVPIARGEHIIEANEKSRPEFYILTSGEVAIYKPSYEGSTQILCHSDGHVSSDAADHDDSHMDRILKARDKVLQVQKKVSKGREDAEELQDFTPDEVHKAIEMLTNRKISKGRARLAFAAMNLNEDERADLGEFVTWYVRKFVESNEAMKLGAPLTILKPWSVFGTWSAFDVGKEDEVLEYAYVAETACDLVRICADELIAEFQNEPAVMRLIDRCFIMPAREFGSSLDIVRNTDPNYRKSLKQKGSFKFNQLRRRNTSKRIETALDNSNEKSSKGASFLSRLIGGSSKVVPE